MATIVIAMAGGLGLFLFGMKLMSEGLEKAAGARMRNILEFFTKNRFVGLMVGMLVTAVIQSSSATTVMVVSFVNSGLMNLFQASGVILGANIGTTITGQLIAFNLSEVAPLFVIIGVIMVMFSKKLNVRRVGEVVLGFGVLFMGLSNMSTAMSSLKESPRIVEILQSLSSPLMAVLVGFVITAILQSSSATVGIVILMASQGMLLFTICPFLVIGCNMGSCVSALLASLGGKKDAKRAAWIHFLFNIIGSTVIFIVLLLALTPITDAVMSFSGNNMARAVANMHTIIKIVEVIILFPFMNYIVKATYRIIPGKDATPEDEFELKYIGEKTMLTPATAIVDAIGEIENMAAVAAENLKLSMEVLCGPEERKIATVYKNEKYINYLNREITNYLVKTTEMELPLADAKLSGGLFHVINDIERIGDHAENFADAAAIRLKQNIDLTDKGEKQLQDMTEMVTEMLTLSIKMFSEQDRVHMQEIIYMEEKINKKEKKLQYSHVKRLTKGKYTPEAGMIFSDTVSGLERVADHAINIAFAILELEDYDEDDED